MSGLVRGITDAIGLTAETPEPVRGPSVSEQVAGSKEMAIWNAGLNRINQETPFSSTQYIRTGTDANGVPQYTQKTTLTGLGQQQLNLMQQGQQAAGSLLPSITQNARNLLTEDAGANVQLSYGENANTIQKAYDSYLSRGTTEINKTFDQQRSLIEQKLFNQGVSADSDAYRTALQDYEKGRSDALAMLSFQALQTADQRSMQAAAFTNQALAQQMNMRQAATNTGQNLYSMLYNAGQASTNMSAPGYNQVQGVDYGSIIGRDLATQQFNNQLTWTADKAAADTISQYMTPVATKAGGKLAGMF